MKKFCKIWKKQIEKDLWIPPIKDLIEYEERNDLKEFLQELEKEAKKRFNNILSEKL